jgi:hypothetical protein
MYPVQLLHETYDMSIVSFIISGVFDPLNGKCGIEQYKTK